MIINIHAGHNPDGKTACGAIGFIQESTEARKVKDEVISRLRQMGHTVYDCTCENGASQSDVLVKIVNACNAHTVDLDVSIHFNAGAKGSAKDGKTTGTETLVYSESGRAKPYAQNICNAIASLGFRNRGVKTNKNLYFLRKTKAPSLLIECCFVDDRDDVALYDHQKIAGAIVYGITGKNTLQSGSADTDEKNAEDASSAADETPTGNKNAVYRVQVGAYSASDNAKNMQKRLIAAGFDAMVVKS